ncbi:MAG: glycoside hydrolase family 97 protein [Paenibacillaceae bacterium]|jgi:alpha-glucosidase|nr:glycoside hydrolase family 97 protein [Paenibacillaceae bacterium]
MAMQQIYSPDHRLLLTLALEEGSLFYHATLCGRSVMGRSPLGLDTDICDFTNGLTPIEVFRSTAEEDFAIPAFKKPLCKTHASCLTWILTKRGHFLHAEAWVSNDGAAVRLSVPGQGPVTVYREAAGFRVPENTANLYAQKLLFSYEDFYNPVPIDDLHQNALGFPLLAQLGSSLWALYTEAAVFGNDYGGSHLSSTREDPALLMLQRAPDQLGFSACERPFSTPWRTVITGTLETIINSNVLESLSSPSIVEDPSFIKPGRSLWSWMCDKDAHKDPVKMREYIDAAAAMKFEYSLIDGGWSGNIDIPSMVEYGAAKGVGIWIWAHSQDLRDPAAAEEKLKLWSAWGVAGLKLDFFESDSQERIRQYNMLAELAAQYRLMLNFHGSTKPGGASRLWPHVLTYEGVMGSEFYLDYCSFAPAGPDAAHNCTLPFTRNAVGPMDYTPVVYESRKTGTTDAHQTALTVVFTSYALHLAEKASVLLVHPCRPFLTHVPVVWDETRLLEGMPASYVTMARRSGKSWFIGGICARRPRTADFSLDFLTEEGDYEATLYSDDLSDMLTFDAALGALPAADESTIRFLDSRRVRPSLHEHNMRLVKVSSFTVRAGDRLAVPMAANGGFALQLRPAAEK